MKLYKLSLLNFKFHHDLEINFNGKNTLIYGENGVGKSSIYEALRINLQSSIVSRGVDLNELYKHRNYSENMKVDLFFDEDLSKTITREQNILTNSLEYFSILANEKKFSTLLDTDFYRYLADDLQVDFNYLSPLLDIYKALEIDIDRNVTEKNLGEYVDKRIASDSSFESLFNTLIDENEINNILQNNFKEDFKIKFNIKLSEIFSLKLIHPTISISIVDIDDGGNFHEHFNEAKLKLISIAIYFSLAKKQESKLTSVKNESKFLILDDFLTSLDMSNRKLIIQYILDNFTDYQKIILTHNIQFNNLIIKLLGSRDEKENWNFKNIFSTKENKSIIYDKQTDYLKVAQDYLDEDKLTESGNFLRKEFERILEELSIIHEIGSKEKLSHIINGLLKQDVNNQYRFTATLKDNINNMKSVLKKTKFYQDTILHSASHNDIFNEIYAKDCRGAIEVLIQLNKYIKNIKEN